MQRCVPICLFIIHHIKEGQTKRQGYFEMMKQISQVRICIQRDIALLINLLMIDEGRNVDFYFNGNFSINRLLRVFIQRTVAVVYSSLRFEANPSKWEKSKRVNIYTYCTVNWITLLYWMHVLRSAFNSHTRKL